MPKEQTPAERHWERYKANALKTVRSHRNLRKRDFIAGYEAAEKVQRFIATAENLSEGLASMSPEALEVFVALNREDLSRLRKFLMGDSNG